MKCLTLCGEEVYYERHEFPNGYYLVPRNNDHSVHECEKIRTDGWTYPTTNDVGSLLDSEINNFLYEIQDFLFDTTDEKIKNDKYFANEILNTLFFINNHFCSDPFLYMGEFTNLSYDANSELPNLSMISKIYELQNDFESAKKCEMIKFEINGSISKNFPELLRKDKENYSIEDSHSVAAIRYKLRIIEDEMTNLIRTKIDEATLEQFFPDVCSKAFDRRKKNESDHPEKKDLLDWMDFGDRRSVLGNWSTKVPEIFRFKINKVINWRLNELNIARNRIDHHTKPQPLDEFMSENERMMKSLMCDQCIEYLKDQISKAT